MSSEVRRKSILKLCPANVDCKGCASCGGNGVADEGEKTVKIVDIRKVPPENVNSWLDQATYVWEYFKVDLYDVFELEHMPILAALNSDTAAFSKNKAEQDLLKAIDSVLKPLDLNVDTEGLDVDQFLDVNEHLTAKWKSMKAGSQYFQSTLIRLGSLLAQAGHAVNTGSCVSSDAARECFTKLVQLTGLMAESVGPSGKGKASIEVKDVLHAAKPHIYINLPMAVSSVDDTPAKLIATVHCWGSHAENMENPDNPCETVDEEQELSPSPCERSPSPAPASGDLPAPCPKPRVPTPSLVTQDTEDIDDADKGEPAIKSRSKFANLRLDESLKSLSEAWSQPPNCYLILDESQIEAKQHLAVVFGEMMCAYSEANVFDWTAEGCQTNYRLAFSVQSTKVQVVAMEMLSDVAQQLTSHQMVRHHHIPLYVSPVLDMLCRSDRTSLVNFLMLLKCAASNLNPW